MSSHSASRPPQAWKDMGVQENMHQWQVQSMKITQQSRKDHTTGQFCQVLMHPVLDDAVVAVSGQLWETRCGRNNAIRKTLVLNEFLRKNLYDTIMYVRPTCSPDVSKVLKTSRLPELFV